MVLLVKLHMLERLFGSASRSKIIKFFCTHPQDKYYMRELARKLDIKLNALSRELENLVELGFLIPETLNGKKYYSVDQGFPLLNELQSMIVKSIVLLEKAIVRDLRSIRGIQVLMLTGIFNNQNTDTDVLIVGSVDKSKVKRLILALSKSFYQDIRFTILTTTEYRYRLEVTDKFVHKILNYSPITIINKLTR